ncbi:sodium/panthothenate symporter [compost metagenome]
MNDRQFLLAMRLSVVAMTVATSVFALYSDASIYEMVGNAYKVTLVAAVVPLFAGLFWKRATTQGALLAIASGLLSWVYLEASYVDTDFWPPQLAGLLCSALGMLLGSLLPQFVRSRRESLEPVAA